MTAIAITPPALAVSDGGLAPKEYPCTDLGNAERFVARHGDAVRYLPAWRKWLIWDGQRWAQDDTLGIVRLAKDTVRAIYEEVAGLDSKDARRAMFKHATTSESDGKLRAMLSLVQAEPGVAITPQQLDADPWLLAVQNGTIDLRTAELRPHDRADLITKVVPTYYDSVMECPTWHAFLDKVLAGDQELLAFIKRAVGYSLTGITSERAFLFLYGHGRNGKSTFLEVLRALLAGYASQADFSTFMERQGDGPRNDIARLVGTRLVTASEVPEGKRMNESLTKTLIGDETVTARFLHAEHFEFKPAFKLWIAANHRPVIRGTDDGIWDRVRLVPFTVRITDEERDPHLFAKLVAELPGILAWAVAGALEWKRDGLGMAQAVAENTEEYRRDMDTLGAYLEDCCEQGPDTWWENSTTLYQAYAAWCARSGEFQVKLAAFGNALTERGIPKKKVHGKKGRVGIRLRADLPLYAMHTRPDAAPEAAATPQDGQEALHI